jgi:hypothetical protein
LDCTIRDLAEAMDHSMIIFGVMRYDTSRLNALGCSSIFA